MSSPEASAVVVPSQRGVAVTCRRVTHLYQSGGEQVVALRDVDLVITPGESLALLGPSGCGKSTLLSLLAGLQTPTTGQLIVGDHDLSADPRAGRRLRADTVALLLQDPSRALLPYASPRLALTAAGETEVAESLERFDLTPVADRPARTLSAGQQQRLALAAVMARRPGLLLVDEPTSRLEPAERDTVVTSLHAAVARTGSTLVAVTHDPVVASSFPRTLTMRDGRVGAEGRSGVELAVVGADGSLSLPADALAVLAPGSFVRVDVTDDAVLLRPADPDEQP